MARTFNCPSCGAALDYDGDAPVIRCAYCGNTVIAPEELRPAPPSAQPALPVFDAPLTVNLGGLTGAITTLKTVKELARSGQEAEAAHLYQETFGVSAQEAGDLVSRLAAGQIVAFSHAGLDMSVPVAFDVQVQVDTGRQAAQAVRFWRGQVDAGQGRQRGQSGGLVAVIVAVVIGLCLSLGAWLLFLLLAQ